MSRILTAVALVAIALAVPVGSRVAADAAVESAVANAYFPRYTDAELTAVAEARASAIAACGCLEHAGTLPNAGEVLAFNEGFPDPVARVVAAWQRSPGHHAILSDPTYGRIGCGQEVVGDVHWFACVLVPGPLPPAGQAPLLPDTALPPPG